MELVPVPVLLYELNAKIIFFFFFVYPLGIFYSIFQCGRRIRDPAPGRMGYAYILIATFAQSVRRRAVQAYQAPISCGVGLLVTTSESGLSPLHMVHTP